MDEYFIDKLEDLREDFGCKKSELERDLDDPVAPTDAAEMDREGCLVDKAIEYVKSGKILEGDDLAAIAMEALSNKDNYSISATVEATNIEKVDFDVLAGMIGHYSNISLQVKYDGKVFDGRKSSAWQEADIKKNGVIHLYAHCQSGRDARADNLVHDNIVRVLGEELEHPELSDKSYIMRRLEIKDKYGFHMRPAASVIKGASMYDGDVYIRDVRQDLTLPATSIMTLMTKMSDGSKQGDIFEIYFEANSRYDTKEAFATMKQGVQDS